MSRSTTTAHCWRPPAPTEQPASGTRPPARKCIPSRALPIRRRLGGLGTLVQPRRLPLRRRMARRWDRQGRRPRDRADRPRDPVGPDAEGHILRPDGCPARHRVGVDPTAGVVDVASGNEVFALEGHRSLDGRLEPRRRIDRHGERRRQRPHLRRPHGQPALRRPRPRAARCTAWTGAPTPPVS